MIQANELRIGNWVYKLGIDYIEDHPVPDHNDTTAVIVDLNVLNNIINHDGTINMPCYDPIPLTPEILGKAGFVKYVSGCMEIKCKMFNISWDTETVMIYDPEFSNGAGIIGFHCKHLHQLQNLYFALTWEELNIEL